MSYRIFGLILATLTAGCAASSADTRIPPPGTHYIRIVPGNDLWNITGKKKPQLLFDSNIDDNNKTDPEYGMENAFATPMIFFVSLGDSCYKQLTIDYFHGYGSSNWMVTLYDSNRVQLSEFPLKGVYKNWALSKEGEKVQQSVRFIRFISQDPASDLRELRIYGAAVAKCSPVAASAKAIKLTDPGFQFQGGSSLIGKDTNYMKLSSGLPLYGSFRTVSNVFYWSHDNASPFDAQTFGLDKINDLERTTLRFHKRMGTSMMLYINGASTQTVKDLKGDDYNSLAQSNNYKDIPAGSDSTSYEAWTKNHGRMWKVMAHLYGGNKRSALSARYRVQGNVALTPGQANINAYEIGNEDDKTWLGMAAYHSPSVLYPKLKVAYDSIKSVDPNAQVYLGALLCADTTVWKALYFLHYWQNPGKPFPADGFCFNQYINNKYGGQSHATEAEAVSPEQFKITERVKAIRDFRDHYFPGKGIRWTELGYAINKESDYDVHEVTGIPDSIVAPNFMVRSLERAAVVENGLDGLYNYFHTSDGTGIFGSMYMVVEQFDPNNGMYTGSWRRPIWYWYATRMNVLHDYKGWSTMIKDGDSTGVTVTRYDHVLDAKKKVYYIVRGTYNGSVSNNYAVPVGKATKATLVTMAAGKEEGERKELPVTNGKVTVPVVNEGPQYIIVQE